MYARRTERAGRRRGVVLVLILGMLGLLALIGVTFATFSGQAQISARFASESVHTPPAEQVISFALDQLINDTGNPASAIRGHSLKRDMYGNDASINVYLNRLPEPLNQPLVVTSVSQAPSSTTDHTPFIVVTNIPANSNPLIRSAPQLYNANFTGCVLRLSQWIVLNDGNYTPVQQIQRPDRLTQTFEIVADDASGNYHVLKLTYADLRTTVTNTDGTPSTTFAFVQPNSGPPANMSVNTANLFEIDGRYMRAFNGTGLDKVSVVDSYGNTRPYSAYPNFLYNNLVQTGINSPANPANFSTTAAFNDPNNFSFHMDEDYDGADNENMFLSIRNADGSLIIPSFHRPGNIVYNSQNTAQNDWQTTTPDARSKFLRPRKIDHPLSGNTFPDLIPDASGKITYDVDNDGDGSPDSVWVDLGYPVQTDPTGKQYKPLFAFMVQGLNGKLPLNTVGNLHRLSYNQPLGSPDLNVNRAIDHASHIGYSVNEINPEYALKPAGDATAFPGLAQGYLQVLLQGNPGDPNATPPVPPTEGRFGEVELIRASNGTAFPRAGRSWLPGQSYSATAYPKNDMLDSDFTTTDFFPGTPANPPPLTPALAENADKLDNANAVLLPVERFRRFVTPIDLSGNGRMVEFGNPPNGPLDFGLGADAKGRVNHFLYFRPPGMPNRVGANGVGELPTPLPDPMNPLRNLSDNTINILHGYESYRNPPGGYRNYMAPMPWDLNRGVDQLPTFSTSINSYSPADYVSAGVTAFNGIYPGGSMGLQEAAQMNLYEKTAYDSPFGFGDQELLDRKGDVDDAALGTRLTKLLPDILNDTTNSPVKRKLFSIDSWDTTTWAAPVSTMGTVFGVPTANPTNTAGNYQQFDSTGTLPALMQGGRKINLNLPLPVSDDPREAVRQKWCRDTYQMIKCVLFPPDGTILDPSTNTRVSPPAETLAAIGQYVVNIIDFRDPDSTMTEFLNYDLVETPATVGSVPATAGNAASPTNANQTPPPPVSLITVPAGVGLYGGAPPNNNPLSQWGMEYNPVAITEILGYQYIRHGPMDAADTVTPRLFIELVNTLTKDYGTGSGPPVGTPPDTSDGHASSLGLAGWGFIITQDDPGATDETLSAVERPNRITGQLRQSTIDNFFVPLYTDPTTSLPADLPKKLPPLNLRGTNGSAYYVFGNYINNIAPANQNDTNDPTFPNYFGYLGVERNTPAIDAQLDDKLVKQIPLTALTTSDMTSLADKDRGRYYWLHLLRPSNPKDITSKKVVVDSFRFPYFVDNGSAKMLDANNTTVTRGTNALYSARRLQPFRGGHFIPYSETYPNAPNPYGYTEQTFPTTTQNPPASTDTTKPQPVTDIYPQKTSGVTKNAQIAGNIYHSLNTANSGAENWDIFPFHDRDFQSVAELLLVPACPPGLFTKQFVEYPNPTPYNVDASKNFTGMLPPTAAQLNRNSQDYLRHYYPPPWNKTSEVGMTGDPLTVPSATLPLTGNGIAGDTCGIPPTISQYTFSAAGRTGFPSANMPDPCAFPYLPEAFFYSYGLKSGWYKLMEFFQVPSTSFGYIGPVAAGQNADWAQRDLRPGLLNLNLIADEEVFFGLLDDPRVNDAPAGATAYYLPPPNTTPAQPVGVTGVPVYATAVYPNGIPSGIASIGNRGFNNGAGTNMKAAFADFLKIRDGGSGVVFSPFSTSPYSPIWGLPDPNTNLMATMPSRPYRSLANQYAGATASFNIDINDTVMRPARLPAYQLNIMNADPTLDPYHVDQAQRFDAVLNPFYTMGGTQPQYLAATPRIPPRRLFQIPDADNLTVGLTLLQFPSPDGDPATQRNPYLQLFNADPATPALFGWSDGDGIFLTKKNSSLFKNTSYAIPPDPVTPPPPPGVRPRQGYLGGSTYVGTGAGDYPSVTDHRWHPMYRTEMLSKVMNQTTTRTHQFAVWLTVGFFEVVKPGNPLLVNSYDPVTGASMALDQLGNEIGADVGKNVRYRSYYLLDRTRATGFNPYEPGDFRDLIVFSRRIE